MILYNIFLGDFSVLNLFPGFRTKSALQASRSAAPARKFAFHIRIYIYTNRYNQLYLIFMYTFSCVDGRGACSMFFVLQLSS